MQPIIHHRVRSTANYESNSCPKECQLSFGGSNKKNQNQNYKVLFNNDTYNLLLALHSQSVHL